MSGTNALKATMLDNWGVTQLSLHTAYSSSGANEVTGGSYARINATFSATSGGSKALSNQPQFSVPATTVRWIGKWMGATFAGMSPNGGSEKEFFVDISTDIVTCYAHGYTPNQTISMFADTPPGGVTEGAVIYVINPTADTFQVSLSSGGAAINLTSVPGGACVVSKMVEETFSAPGNFTVTSGASNLNG